MTNLTNPAAQLTDVRDMAVIHQAFRRELRLIPTMVRGVRAGDTARATTVADHTRLLLNGLHIHHTGEDELLWPLLLERAAPSAELVHRMEGQHHRVESLIDEMPDLLSRWTARADPSAGEDLAGTVDALRVVLLEHLDDEEAQILPIAARTVSPAEWAALGDHGVESMSRRELPIFFGMILEDATPNERAMMLAGAPAPARLFLRTVGAWQYRRYVARVRG